MKHLLLLSILACALTVNAQKVTIVDSISRQPVSFATISFGNGQGTFADGDGVFTLSRKRYPNLDSLLFTSVGYKDLSMAATDIKDMVQMIPSTNVMDEIVIMARLNGKFKEEEIDAITHDEYMNCWLPTVESEIAVRFDRIDDRLTSIKEIHIPVMVEESQNKRGKPIPFSTMFRIQFYSVDNDGSPHPTSNYPSQTFVINQETDDVFTVNLEELNVQIPKEGIFAAIQVLGFTYPDGRLIDAKKYREIKTRRGMVKISTTYRPLLPFTDDLETSQTWVRRIFFNDKKWQAFDLSYNPNSALVRSGHINYKMGAVLKVYQPKD